ncbi:hypothetical protein ACFFX0_21250 [Citricoccus parietis]|uniref:Uncharacterized protein n=1 Tax=Citricoccus parietis TaxID=592307 RepID=A0ABV5G3U8_9MICC
MAPRSAGRSDVAGASLAESITAPFAACVDTAAVVTSGEATASARASIEPGRTVAMNSPPSMVDSVVKSPPNTAWEAMTSWPSSS